MCIALSQNLTEITYSPGDSMAGRPKKYFTREEALAAQAKAAREKYAAKKGVVREYLIDPNAEKYRGTKVYSLYHSCKSRAKKNGIPFDLDAEYIAKLLNESEKCPLLGIPYDDGRYTQSLDKIIPELGYIKGNVWAVSYRANSIKNDASIDELRMIVEGLAKKLDKK